MVETPIEVEQFTWKIFGKGLGCSLQDPDIGGLLLTWNSKQPVFNACFNWMIPNLYIGNGWKSPFPSIYKWLALEFQVLIHFFYMLRNIVVLGNLPVIYSSSSWGDIHSRSTWPTHVGFEVLHRWRGQSMPQICQGPVRGKLLQEMWFVTSQYCRILLKHVLFNKKR